METKTKRQIKIDRLMKRLDVWITKTLCYPVNKFNKVKWGLVIYNTFIFPIKQSLEFRLRRFI